MHDRKQYNHIAELEACIYQLERSFLLLYKGGTEQSECALNTDQEVWTAKSSHFYLQM